jgi:hypothetical protein
VRKSAKNYIVFVILLILGLLEAVSGFVLWFALPRGGGYGGRFGGGAEYTFWLLSRHTWIDIHNWVAAAILVVVIIHLILHWKWIIYITKKVFQVKSSTVRNLT